MSNSVKKTVTPPAQAEKFGMTNLSFYDDFDSQDTIDVKNTHQPGYNWYVQPPFRCPVLSADELKVEDSVLCYHPSSGGSIFPSYSKMGRTGFTFRYAYAEARIRIDVEEQLNFGELDCWPAFWAHSLTDCLGEHWDRCGELDIFEAFQLRSDNEKNTLGKNMVFYNGALHDHVKQPEGIPNVIGSNLVNATGYNDQFDFVDNDWHVYGTLLDKGIAEFYMDNKLMHSIRYDQDRLPDYFYRDNPDPLPRIEHTRPELLSRTFPGAHEIMDRENLVVILQAHEKWPMYVDWVRVWQK